MMKYFLLSILILGLISCNKDLDQLMLRGEAEDYNFTNAELEEFTVNESWIYPMTLTSVNSQWGNVAIKALYVGDTSLIDTDTIVLYLHGNAPSLQSYWENIARIANVGGMHRYGVMSLDYRGFGNSEGLSEDINTMVSDAEAALRWLKSKGLTNERLVIHGESLGTMPSAHTSAYSAIMTPAKLVLETPQTSVNVLVQDATGLSFGAGALTDFNYDIPSALNQFSNDFLWMHGTADNVASYPNFLQVYDAYENPNKQKYIVPDGGHILYDHISFQEYETMMLDYLIH